MSTSYPIAFKPVCSEEGCFIDGGLLNNFPLNDCLEQTKCDESEVLAFKNIWSKSAGVERITPESSIIDYMIRLTKQMQGEICTESRQSVIKNIVKCHVDGLSNISDWLSAVATGEVRASLIEKGKEQGKLFLL